MALQFEARKVALKQDRTGYVLTLSIHPDDIPVELLRDFVGARYALAMVRIEDDESPRQYTNHVSAAGMMCRDPAFHQYLMDANNMESCNESDAASMVCTYCQIESRSELNGNELAQSLFDKLQNNFQEWKNKNDPF